MKNSLLQRVNEGNANGGSLKGVAVAFYLISVIVAFIIGGYYERAKAPAAPVTTTVETVSAIPTPADQIPAPVATAAPVPATHFTPPTLITSTEPSSTPVRIEKAVSVAPSVASAPAATPVKQAGAVTVTEAVTDIPVKQDGKITGYINLQPGRQFVPGPVENGQIKMKSGDGFYYVPVKSTDMATR